MDRLESWHGFQIIHMMQIISVESRNCGFREYLPETIGQTDKGTDVTTMWHARWA